MMADVDGQGMPCSIGGPGSRDEIFRLCAMPGRAYDEPAFRQMSLLGCLRAKIGNSHQENGRTLNMVFEITRLGRLETEMTHAIASARCLYCGFRGGDLASDRHGIGIVAMSCDRCALRGG